MKDILALLLFIPLFACSQKMIGDSIYISKDSFSFKVGEKVTIGEPSNLNGNFKYIVLKPTLLTGGEILYLGAGAEGLNYIIKRIIPYGSNEKYGKFYFLIVDGGNLTPYMISTELAIKHGELEKQNSHK